MGGRWQHALLKRQLLHANLGAHPPWKISIEHDCVAQLIPASRQMPAEDTRYLRPRVRRLVHYLTEILQIASGDLSPGNELLPRQIGQATASGADASSHS